ncbi:hypothetical protein [Propionivibrio sp.]|uniref:hypothetical protein n=1 Tax=Propionivibrio sp. TaxID=2212460 RepID=UPI003BF2988F
MKGRKHELNLDPAQVPDQGLWITGDAADALKRGMVEKISMLRRAPTIPRSELDISDQVEVDGITGKYRLKEN